MAESEEAASVAREIAANYPSLPVFLVVAGISPEAKTAVLARVATLEALKEIKTDSGEYITSLHILLDSVYLSYRILTNFFAELKKRKRQGTPFHWKLSKFQSSTGSS